MATQYPYATGKDPVYDAWKAGADYRRKVAQDDVTLAQTQAEDDYKKALASLDEQSASGTKNINTSMLARGVFNSGETGVRQADLQAAVLQGRNNAATTRANLLGRASSDLQRAITQIDLEGEQQVAAAMDRQRTSGSGSGSSSGSNGNSTAPAAPASAAAGPMFPLGSYTGGYVPPPAYKPPRSAAQQNFLSLFPARTPPRVTPRPAANMPTVRRF